MGLKVRTIKLIIVAFSPIPILYLLNILIFNGYPEFLGCFYGACLYVPAIMKIKSFEKLVDNFLDKTNKPLSNKDFINLFLIFIITIICTRYIYTFRTTYVNTPDLGFPFALTASIFQFMSWIKIPKIFFN